MARSARWHPLAALGLVLAILGSVIPAVADSVSATPPSAASMLDHVDRCRVVVKFAEQTGVRLRGGELACVVATGRDASPNPAQVDRDLRALADLVAQYPGAHFARRIDLPEEQLSEIRARAAARSGLWLAEMNLYFELQLSSLEDDAAERERLAALLPRLNALASVQVAYADPLPEVATLGLRPIAIPLAPTGAMRTTTPDFSDLQGYLYDAPVGVEADEAWNFPGGRGAGVKIVDIEFGWRFTHEDLQDPFFVDGDPGTDNHGTAVLGEYSGIDNGYGVVGISPDVEVGGVSINGMNLAQAIMLLTTVLDPGDIYVIELHAIGPFGDWIPMEYWQDSFDAIQTAAALGIIGCEAAGNGSQDLDFPGYGGAFDRRLRDSGAIMCGAGTPEGLEGEWFTNFGSRVDLEGWGSSVVTTGYGDLWDTGPDSIYTAGFNGTSSATPIVTGSVASLQGQALDLFGEPLTPWLAAEILSRTGSPWNGPKEIGERPNLLAARDLITQGFADVGVTVRDAETLLPLEGMVIEILETGRLAISGPDGRIALQMSAGDYTLHSDGTFFYGSADLALTVVAGEDQDLVLDLSLLPTGGVVGTIFDARLEGVVDARLECLGTPLDLVYTDSDGRFAFESIPEDLGYTFLVGAVPGLSATYRQWDILGGESQHWYPVLIDAQNFEDSNGGYSGQGNWEWGHPVGMGPGGAFSGENCWGTRLIGYYHTYQWINLTSPPFDYAGADDLQLSFHHWYWTEAYHDGGQVQVNRGDGDWHVVTPIGGYDYETIPTLGPGYTGDSGGWQDAVFDISEHIGGALQVRFRFVSDNSGIGPGWYIDDVALDDGSAGAATVDLLPDESGNAAWGSDPGGPRLLLRGAAPNPSVGATRIAWQLPRSARGELRVCDAQGRCVRTLQSGVLPAGRQVSQWDGRDADGRVAPAGIYYAQLRVDGLGEASRPLIRVR